MDGRIACFRSPKTRYNPPIASVLRSVSAVCFYLLGLGAFAAYALLKNRIGGDIPLLALRSLDLPLLLSGIVYGGISLAQSFESHRGAASIVGWFLAVPLGMIFLLFLTLTFWDVFVHP